MQLKKILIGSSSPPDAGRGIYAYCKDLSEYLLAHGIEVVFLSPPPGDRTWLDQNGVAHIETSPQEDPAAMAKRVLQSVREHRVDGAINNDNPVLQGLAPALSCPVLSVGHVDFGSIAHLPCYNHRWIDHVVAISYDMQGVFVNMHGVPVFKCPVVLNGAHDYGHLNVGSSDDAGPLRVVYSGGSGRFKGAADVLETIKLGQNLWNNVRVDCFGDLGRTMAKRLSEYAPIVTVHGHVPRQRFLETLGQADVLFFPSRREACPMAMLEALSCSTIPIASDGRGAMRWIISSGTEGYICSIGKWPQQVAECVLHLESHHDLRNAMKQACRTRYERDFTTGAAASRLLELLQRPTVDRSAAPSALDVLHWHRPFEPLFKRSRSSVGGKRSSVLQKASLRLASKAGRLRVAGQIPLPETTSQT